MFTFTTDAFELPTDASPTSEVRNTRHGPALLSAAPASSHAAGDGSSQFAACFCSGESLSSSSSTAGGTRRSTEIGLGSPSTSTDQSSHLGSQSELEGEFEEGSTERMESLVSGLLQDEGLECHAAAQLPAKVLKGSSSGRDPSLEIARRTRELRTQYQERRANGGYVGARGERGSEVDHLRTNMRPAGRPLPPTKVVSPYGDSREENYNHQMLQANEALLRASLQEAASLPADDDNVNLSYFSNSEQCGVGSINSKVHMPMPIPQDLEHAYALQRELVLDGMACAIQNREYATELALEVMNYREITRALNARVEYAAEVLADREILRRHERLVSGLQMIADSITKSADRNSAERTNDALVALCKCLYERDCATSVAELEKVKRDIRDASQLRPHDQDLHSLQQSYPTAGHFTSQPSFDTDLSSPRLTSMNNNSPFPAAAFPASEAYYNSSPAGFRSGVSPTSQRLQPAAFVRSRSLCNTPERRPGGYHVNTTSPPRRISSPRNIRTRAVEAVRAADMPAKFTTGLDPRTPTRVSAFPSASPPAKRPGKENANVASISGVNAEFNYRDSFQAPLSDQRSPVAMQSAGNTSGSPTPAPHRDTPATKVLIAQGVKSISVLLKSENSASGGRNSYSAPLRRDAHVPTTVPEESGSLSPIRPRRLDMSDVDHGSNSVQKLIPIEHPSVELDVCNQGQFKTELCNNWQETQFCPYGEHCRFAHGREELRGVLRHPRYKTIPCRMIMTGQHCIYGHRCHFRHSLTTAEELSLISVIDVHDPVVRRRAMSTSSIVN